jgi:DNA-binding LacI/PurR family transcriptional regulator
MQKRARKPSAHDVARLAGVSQAAVSRAYTKGASIAKETRDNILRIGKSVGYHPNPHARSLIKGETGIVGTVIGNPQNAVFMAALGALSKGLSKAGKHLIVATAEGSPTADAQVTELLNYRVDALLIMATRISSKLSRQCRAEGVPVISLNRGLREELPNLTSNDREGARQIAAHLIEQGYSRFGVIAGDPGSAVSEERVSAFTAYMEGRGIGAPVREVGYFRRHETMQAMRALLSQKVRPDAIFCATDYMAFAAIEVARYEFGLDIGPDIGIAGFDDIRESAWPSFDLTTFSLPIVPMINKALEVLLSKTPIHSSFRIVVDGEFRARGSTIRRRNPRSKKRASKR